MTCRQACRILAIVFAAASFAAAQTTFGVIRGRVLDPSGSAVPNVTVVVTNTGTNIAKSVVSNEAGMYEAGYLQPGTYSVAAEQQGFKKFLVQGIVLSATAILGVDVKLEVGELSSSVTVEAGAPLINTESAVISDVKTQQQYLQAPMNLRGNWDSFLYPFMSMVPGAQPTLNSYSISFAGSRYTMNNFTVDGITTNSPLFGNQIGPANPSMDFIREVKVDMSGNSAEFSAPGYVGVITRGGENAFHGSAYWYYNTGGLNARDFFASRTGFAVLHDYGFSFSGPVIKNKTFFSGGLEAFSFRNAAQLTLNLPSDRLRKGDVSGLLGRGAPAAINDPIGGGVFPNGVIPASRVNATALKIQERFYPAANYGDPEGVVGNYRSLVKQSQTKQQVDIRIDHQFSSKNSFFGRFGMMRAPNQPLEGPLPTIGFRIQTRQTRNVVLSDTHMIRPNLINEFRFGLVRGFNPRSGPINGPKIIQELGLTGLPANLPDVYAMPTFNITGFQAIQQIAYNTPAEMIYQWQDNLSWVRGRHTIKMGAEVWHNYGASYQVSPTNAFGNVSFTGSYTGYAYSDFLLGIARSASRASSGVVRVYRTNNDMFFFVQDDWKATSKLTVNFGLRYEFNPPYAEKEDRLSSFDPLTGRLVVPTAAAKTVLNSAFVASNLVPIVLADQAGLPTRTLAFSDRNNFAPRLGLAYKLSPKTVMRAGAGIFYDTFTASLWGSLAGGPYSGTESAPPNAITNGVPLWQLPAMFPAALTQSGTASLVGLDPHMRNPYVMQWNFTLEREIWNMGLRASYVGTKSNRLLITRNVNQVPASTTPYNANRRPYPQLSGVTWRDNAGTAFYNGLVLSAERKYKNGFQYQLSYTWAKNLTDSHDEGEGGGGLQDAYNRRAEWADHQYTRRQRFVLNSIYELPFGKDSSRAMKYLIHGWSISTFAVVQTGPYFTPTFSGGDPANVGGSGGRPDRIGSGELSNPTITRWFDKAAFVVPAANAGRFGNSGVNILRAPGTKVLNAGFFKRFDVTERFRLQMEGTFTNVLNHPNFAAPNTSIDTAAGGVILATQAVESAGARSTRFALRLDF